ncbi:HD family hydrolase [Micromonospora sp. NPDC050276]|uniref:HD family hydrolase n=1 Tax=Micromonospora sp. NPDC050276 TaxID=3364278 RepID=UPI0037ABEC9A
MTWVTVGPPGHLGSRRAARHAEWDARYGSGNWRLRWRVGPALHEQAAAVALYEDAYVAHLTAHPWLLETLVSTARDVWDHEPADTASGLDYTVQRGRSTHLQDIAVRRALVRLGTWFAGSELIRLRRPTDGSTGVAADLGTRLDSGLVPFHRPDLCADDELPGWWQPGSVESFYQSNRVLQHRCDAVATWSMPDTLADRPLDPDLRARLDFLVEAHRLTGVDRLNRLLTDARSESSAEHSWHLGLMVTVLGPVLAPGLDHSRVTTMLAIHDLVEIEAGDVPVYDVDGRSDVAAREAEAAARVFGRLPAAQSADLHALWHEFEAAETAEARFAKAIDRLQPVLLHWAGGGRVWRRRGTSAAEERRVTASIQRHWPDLWPLTDALIDDARARGMLAG